MIKHKRRLASALSLAAVLAVGAWLPAAAQEGFPLEGTWLGTWESNTVNGDSVFLVLDWNGKSISGTVNPGTDNMPITDASLTPKGWLVHLEADAKDKSGKPVHYVIDGKIEHLELPNRTIVGTWKSEEGSGAFNVSRQ
ncbi:MAG TPA: hypothetical protein VFY39_03880 [Gammaproteobacteria bacterium]|nr:hypothetical protein [Gammaproteobacteria bacterium]